MTDYTYAQLEGLWLNAAKGTKYDSREWAALMAAIAEAESGGNSDAHNPSGASGLWQILGDPFPGNVYDPATNARMAVAKLQSQGLGAWTTYTSGAYKAYLSGKTTPDLTGIEGSPTAQAAASATAGASDCLLGNPLAVSLPLVGSISAGPSCLFSKSNARAFIGAGLLAAGALVGAGGLAVLAAAAGMKLAAPVGGAAQAAGGAMMLIPGLEGAGAATVAAGKAARSPSKAGQARGQRRRAQRDKEGKAADAMLAQENRRRERASSTKEPINLAERRRARGETSRSRARRYTSGSTSAASAAEAGF